jgi:hypothetical protein
MIDCLKFDDDLFIHMTTIKFDENLLDRCFRSRHEFYIILILLIFSYISLSFSVWMFCKTPWLQSWKFIYAIYWLAIVKLQILPKEKMIRNIFFSAKDHVFCNKLYFYSFFAMFWSSPIPYKFFVVMKIRCLVLFYWLWRGNCKSCVIPAEIFVYCEKAIPVSHEFILEQRYHIWYTNIVALVTIVDYFYYLDYLYMFIRNILISSFTNCICSSNTSFAKHERLGIQTIHSLIQIKFGQ